MRNVCVSAFAGGDYMNNKAALHSGGKLKVFYHAIQITAEHQLLGNGRSNHRSQKKRNTLSSRFRMLKEVITSC
jgi:hypothetical protein